MPIKTPDVLPGEPGWEEYKKKREKRRALDPTKKVRKKTPDQIGNIILGEKAFRFSLPLRTYKQETKYYIWRYRRKVGEITVDEKEKVSLVFFKQKQLANFKDLITDSDFQKELSKKENDLLENQKDCFICGKKISKTAKPNLYHYNLFLKKAQILEESENVPNEVVKGKLTITEGWEKYNNVLEEINRYFMSLKDTALICASCAKTKQTDTY